MGLGKSLQVIATLLTLLSKGKENAFDEQILILCPTICIQNWQAEFKKWCSEAELEAYPIFTLNATSSLGTNPGEIHSALTNRVEQLEKWHDHGSGIMIMGYEMYRLLLTYDQQKYANGVESNMCTRLSNDTIEFSN